MAACACDVSHAGLRGMRSKFRAGDDVSDPGPDENGDVSSGDELVFDSDLRWNSDSLRKMGRAERNWMECGTEIGNLPGQGCQANGCDSRPGMVDVGGPDR